MFLNYELKIYTEFKIRFHIILTKIFNKYIWSLSSKRWTLIVYKNYRIKWKRLIKKGWINIMIVI